LEEAGFFSVLAAGLYVGLSSWMKQAIFLGEKSK